MYRRAFLIAMVAMYASRSRAAGWRLITDEEFQSDRVAPHTPEVVPFSLPAEGAPIIEVKQPDVTKPIKSPVTIELRFSAQNGAKIDTSSFRATYGWLSIDITSRILDHAQLTEEGLVAMDANLPSGNHKVSLQIGDNRQRITVRTFQFTIL
jgi:hypothetical protein